MISSFPVLAIFVGRALATFDIDSSPNAVGICYSVWHSLGFSGTTPPDITEIENGNGDFAGQGAWHFWGRPDGGYYGGGNRTVLERHFSEISDAKVDFIVIDATNLQGYGRYHAGLFTEPTDVLLDEMERQRAAGKPTPYIVFWVRTGAGDDDPAAVGRFVLNRYHKRSDYSDFWVTLDGKPLLLTTATLPEELTQSFTLRKMWGAQSSLAEGEWSFLQDAPQHVGMKDDVAEQVSVCTAKQMPYMSNKETAVSREEGETYQLQWRRAFDVHPKVVVLTWWNEWIAQRQTDDAEGNPQFVDNYDGEYSRDIEPQDPDQPTSHGSHYLNWTKIFIVV